MYPLTLVPCLVDWTTHGTYVPRRTTVNTSTFSIESINFTAIPNTPISMGAIELIGTGESIAIGDTIVSGPGTVSVWRWSNGTVKAQIERPTGEFEKVAA